MDSLFIACEDTISNAKDAYILMQNTPSIRYAYEQRDAER